MNVLVLVGSLRTDSLNRRLAEAALDHLPAGVTGTVFEGLADLPHYSQDLDAEPLPRVAADLREAVAAADALLVVTPEYNGSLPSALKNAIDWASRPRGPPPSRAPPPRCSRPPARPAGPSGPARTPSASSPSRVRPSSRTPWASARRSTPSSTAGSPTATSTPPCGACVARLTREVEAAQAA